MSSEYVTLRFCNQFSIILKVITLATYVLTILELNWNHHMLTSSTHLQNRPFSRRGKKRERLRNV